MSLILSEKRPSIRLSKPDLGSLKPELRWSTTEGKKNLKRLGWAAMAGAWALMINSYVQNEYFSGHSNGPSTAGNVPRLTSAEATPPRSELEERHVTHTAKAGT